MLKLRMIRGQTATIGNDVTIKCLSGFANIGIDAPESVKIVRNYDYPDGEDEKALAKANRLTVEQQLRGKL